MVKLINIQVNCAMNLLLELTSLIAKYFTPDVEKFHLYRKGFV